MTGLYRSLSDSDLFISLDNNSNASNSIYQCWPLRNSWPEFTGANSTEIIPPNYYQLDVYDFNNYNHRCSNNNEQLANGAANDVRRMANQPQHKLTQFQRSISLKDERAYQKRLNDEIDSIKKGNILLSSIVQKNNDDIKLLFNKNQEIVSQLNELGSSHRKLEKKNDDLEEKLHLNMKEVKLIYEDFKQLKNNVSKLQNKLNDSVPSSPSIMGDSFHGSSLTPSFPDSSKASGSLSPFSSPIDRFHSNNAFNLLNQRLELLENKIHHLTNENMDIKLQLECHLKETDQQNESKQNLTKKLQHLTDMNELMQLKLQIVELRLDQSNKNNGQSQTNSNTILTNTNINNTTSYESLLSKSLNHAMKIYETNDFKTNQQPTPIISTQSAPTSSTSIAYVMPNVRNNNINLLPNIQPVLPVQANHEMSNIDNNIGLIRGANHFIQRQHSNDTSINSDRTVISNEHNSSTSSSQSTSRHRCRRRRIRLFPHPRR